MIFPIIELPFGVNELEPFISGKTMSIHYEKHYKGYVNNLNKLTKDINADHETFKSIMLKNHLSNNSLFHNSAQAWNHTFFWKCLNPKKSKPSKELEIILSKNFGSMEKFKEIFSNMALSFFGSGWIWVIKDQSGEIEIVGKSNADNPLTEGKIPLLVCDVWEHAYYLDYQNERNKYIEHFWEIINWDFLEQNLSKNVM
jgi:Fe-Mn family superoxide dismutase